MPAAPLPPNEEERLGNLYYQQILDTAPEKAFDSITEFAAQQFDVPMAIVTLIDRDRQWFKSHYGVEVCETDRSVAFCAHAILSNQTLVVPDTTQDERFADNPLVTGEPFVRFYAGVPLTTSAGYNIGTLCLLDFKPRQISADEQARLERLARVVRTRMELRAATLKLRELNTTLRNQN